MFTLRTPDGREFTVSDPSLVAFYRQSGCEVLSESGGVSEAPPGQADDSGSAAAVDDASVAEPAPKPRARPGRQTRRPTRSS